MESYCDDAFVKIVSSLVRKRRDWAKAATRSALLADTGSLAFGQDAEVRSFRNGAYIASLRMTALRSGHCLVVGV